MGVNKWIIVQFLLLGLSLVSDAYISHSSKEPLRVHFNVTMEQMDSLPSIFEMDEYDKCLRIKPKTLYCVTHFEVTPIDPENPSEVWKVLDHVNSFPRTYRHDLLRYYVCLPRSCPEIPDELYNVEWAEPKLREALAECYNKRFAHYGLKSTVSKARCENEQGFEIDSWDITYAVLVGIFVCFVIISTAYEVLARCQSKEVYQQMTSSGIGRVLTAFALMKNWERLRTDSDASDAKALAPIQGVRVFNMYFVIMCHTCLMLLVGPVSNTEYPENVTLRGVNAFLTNGSLICQTFFIIGAWLVSYQICVIFENRKMTVQHVFLMYLNRFIRLAPVLLLVLGYSTSWARHVNKGPNSYKFAIEDFENCRKNWIWAFLYVNNYVNTPEMCLQQTWTLSVDTQLFMMGMFIMMYVVNNPKKAKYVFSFFIALGIFISICAHYYFDHDIVYRSYPETIHNVYLTLPEWTEAFVATHNHVPCYIVGLACGFYFHKLHKAKKPFIDGFWKLFIARILVWVLPIAQVLSAVVYYQEGSTYTRLGAAIYQGFSRINFGLPIACALLVFCTGKFNVMASVIAWAPFQSLGRLSYSVYLTHSLPLRFKASYLREPQLVNDYIIFSQSLEDFFVSYLVGTIICLFFEMPMSAVQKILFVKQAMVEKGTEKKTNGSMKEKEKKVS